MQNTRERILQYLHIHRQATAPELSRILNLTQANIRHHLDILEREEQIEVVGKLKESGRGRPTFVYMLTKAAQTNSLDILAGALLTEGLTGRPPRQQNKFLENTAKRIAGTHPETSKSITIQLGNAVRRLNDLNYKAHWEAHANAPHLFLGVCPYAQIINRHPELCQMDAALIEHLTGQKFRQVEKISRTQGGTPHCRFILDLESG